MPAPVSVKNDTIGKAVVSTEQSEIEQMQSNPTRKKTNKDKHGKHKYPCIGKRRKRAFFREMALMRKKKINGVNPTVVMSDSAGQTSRDRQALELDRTQAPEVVHVRDNAHDSSNSEMVGVGAPEVVVRARDIAQYSSTSKMVGVRAREVVRVWDMAQYSNTSKMVGIRAPEVVHERNIAHNSSDSRMVDVQAPEVVHERDATHCRTNSDFACAPEPVVIVVQPIAHNSSISVAPKSIPCIRCDVEGTIILICKHAVCRRCELIKHWSANAQMCEYCASIDQLKRDSARIERQLKKSLHVTKSTQPTTIASSEVIRGRCATLHAVILQLAGAEDTQHETTEAVALVLRYLKRYPAVAMGIAEKNKKIFD
uniref:RING-type domain-containing protein n=1 Tax=Plectus sambesii TaxID=2011161 RepID=A0A914V8L0_9BILA